MGFKSWLKQIGEDFKKGLDAVLKVAENPIVQDAVAIAAPGASAMYKATLTAVALAEQNFAAIGKQSGTGAQKLASVVQIAGNLVSQGLADAGQANTAADVENYINSVVKIANTTPAA